MEWLYEKIDQCLFLDDTEKASLKVFCDTHPDRVSAVEEVLVEQEKRMKDIWDTYVVWFNAMTDEYKEEVLSTHHGIFSKRIHDIQREEDVSVAQEWDPDDLLASL